MVFEGAAGGADDARNVSSSGTVLSARVTLVSLSSSSTYLPDASLAIHASQSTPLLVRLAKVMFPSMSEARLNGQAASGVDRLPPPPTGGSDWTDRVMLSLPVQPLLSVTVTL